MRIHHLHGTLCLALLTTVLVVSPAAAQVPVNDAARTTQETNTAVCMERARTFKQSSMAP